jgi:hypothetical protein
VRSWQALSVLLCLCLLAGCQQEETITVTQVTQPDRESLRLLGAIVPFQEYTWVFKLQGPADEIERQKKGFDEFLGSLAFDANKEPPVAWKAPAGWKEEQGSRLRFASFRIPSGSREMELTVTPLPKEGGSVLQNVNRWRKQLALPQLEAAELAGAARPAKIGDQDGHLVDITGLGAHSVSKAPAAGPLPAHPPLTAPRAPRRTSSELPFTFDVPDSWQKDERPAGLSRVSYTVRDGSKKASVTVTPLGGGAGGWQQNIERWRGQVKLPKVSAAELAQQVSDIEVAGVTAKYVDLDNPGAAIDDNRIVGAILPLPDSTWFFKMTGPSTLVGRHKAAFESLVRSIKLGGKE